MAIALRSPAFRLPSGVCIGTKTIFIFVFVFAASANQLGVEFVCPVFTNGVNIVSCRINRTSVITAKCSSNETVIFDQTAVSGITLTKCDIQSFNSSACSPIQEPSHNSCRCHGVDGDIFDYRFAYVANENRDVGGRLECKVCVPSKKELYVNAHENCKKMTFGSPESDGEWSAENIVGCMIGIFVFVLIAAAVIFALSRRCCQRRSSDRIRTEHPSIQEHLQSEV